MAVMLLSDVAVMCLRCVWDAFEIGMWLKCFSISNGLLCGLGMEVNPNTNKLVSGPFGCMNDKLLTHLIMGRGHRFLLCIAYLAPAWSELGKAQPYLKQKYTSNGS